MTLTAKDIAEIERKLGKVQGALRAAKAPIEDLQDAARLMEWALKFIGQEIRTTASGEPTKATKEKTELGNAMVRWVNRTERVRAQSTPQPPAPPADHP